MSPPPRPAPARLRHDGAPDPQLPQHSPEAAPVRRSQLPRRSRFLGLVLASFLAITPAMARDRMTWPDLTKRPQPKADATIAYGPDPMQKVDLWLPAGAGPHPRRADGPWRLLDRRAIADRSLMNWIADDLRRRRHRGVEHRLSRRRPRRRRLSRHLRRCRRRPPTCSRAKATAISPRHAARRRGRPFGGRASRAVARGAGRRLPTASPLRTARPAADRHVVSLGGLPDLEATAASPDNGCGTEVVAQARRHRPRRPLRRHLGPPPAAARRAAGPGQRPRGPDHPLPHGHRLRREGAAPPATASTLHTVPDTGHVELIAPETAAWAEAKRLILAAFVFPKPSFGRTRSDPRRRPRARRRRPARNAAAPASPCPTA